MKANNIEYVQYFDAYNYNCFKQFQLMLSIDLIEWFRIIFLFFFFVCDTKRIKTVF